MIDASNFAHIRLEPAIADGAGNMWPEDRHFLIIPMDVRGSTGFAGLQSYVSLKRTVKRRNTYDVR